MNNIYTKLLKVQEEVAPIKKTETNPFFNSAYFDVNGILAALKPILNKHGLVLTQPLTIVVGEDCNLLTTVLTNAEDGEKITSTVYLPDNLDPQKFGAAVTYYRRYALQSLFALEAQDDDGNSVSQPVNHNPARSEQFTPKKKSDDQTAVAKDLRPGMTELDAHKILKERIAESGAEKIWHPSQIRFGKNTIHSFGEKAEPVPLNENDHLFMDIGPVYDGYEGDVGATYVLGNDPHLTRLSEDSKIIFDEVKKHWSTTGTTGEALYAFAEESARSRGWKLNPNGASGHRVSEFPHSAHYRGKLKSFERQPTPYRWILEIQLFDETRKLGSFFEDLL
ncbi:MAG: ERF family protein [Bdellovibrionota bacterium]